jgi:hypothetical protein
VSADRSAFKLGQHGSRICRQPEDVRSINSDAGTAFLVVFYTECVCKAILSPGVKNGIPKSSRKREIKPQKRILIPKNQLEPASR